MAGLAGLAADARPRPAVSWSAARGPALRAGVAGLAGALAALAAEPRGAGRERLRSAREAARRGLAALRADCCLVPPRSGSPGRPGLAGSAAGVAGLAAGARRVMGPARRFPGPRAGRGRGRGSRGDDALGGRSGWCGRVGGGRQGWRGVGGRAWRVPWPGWRARRPGWRSWRRARRPDPPVSRSDRGGCVLGWPTRSGAGGWRPAARAAVPRRVPAQIAGVPPGHPIQLPSPAWCRQAGTPVPARSRRGEPGPETMLG